MSKESKRIIESLGGNASRPFSFQIWKRPFARVLGDLAGDTCKATIDKFEFDKDWIGEKAEIVLRIRHARPDPFDYSAEKMEEEAEIFSCFMRKAVGQPLAACRSPMFI